MDAHVENMAEIDVNLLTVFREHVKIFNGIMQSTK